MRRLRNRFGQNIGIVGFDCQVVARLGAANRVHMDQDLAAFDIFQEI